MGTFRDLKVYKKAFELMMDIFEVSKSFPSAEKFGLTDQIRRSTRSVCATVAEAYRKRRYEAYFISKSTDADMENTEAQVWLDTALACKYITQAQYDDYISRSEEVGRLLNHMIENPKSYLSKSMMN